MSVVNNWPQLELYLHKANMCLSNEHSQNTLIEWLYRRYSILIHSENKIKCTGKYFDIFYYIFCLNDQHLSFSNF